MRRSVNARVLFVLLATTVVLGTAIHLLHALQMRQNASALARQAQRALTQGRLGKAADYLDRYLTFMPDDTEALALHGQVLDQLADGPQGRGQALQLLEQVLRRDPSRRDLRRRVVSLAIDQYQFRDALDHLERLLATAPESEKGELEHLLGWCHDALGHSEEAVAAFRQAVAQAPRRVFSYVLLAEVLADRLGKLGEAAKVMNALVTANPGSAEALRARARFFEARHDATGAAQDMAQARSLEYRTTRSLVQRRRFAEADEVVRQAAADGLLDKALARLGAEAALGRGDPARALLLARQAVPAPARDYREMLWLARLIEAAAEPNAAAEVLRVTAAKNPGVPDVWSALVGALARSGRPDEARAVLEEAGRKLPPQRQALGLARSYEALGHLDEAEDQYRRYLESQPGDCLRLRAAIEFFRRTDQPGKAEPLLRRLLDPAAQAPPDYLARGRRQLALVLAACGNDEDYQTALALLERKGEGRPITGADARARAVVLASRPSQRLEGLRLFEESLQGQPISEEDQFQRARLCEAAGAPERARLLILDLLATSPENPQYLAFHVRGLIRQGDRTTARVFLDKLERIEPRSARTDELKAMVAEKQ